MNDLVAGSASCPPQCLCGPLFQKILFPRRNSPDQTTLPSPLPSYETLLSRGFHVEGTVRNAIPRLVPQNLPVWSPMCPFFPLCQLDVSNDSAWHTSRWLGSISIPGDHPGDSRPARKTVAHHWGFGSTCSNSKYYFNLFKCCELRVRMPSGNRTTNTHNCLLCAIHSGSNPRMQQ